MKYKYDVSIVIPVYNVSEYLKECINSIINQKYDFNKIQIILIDDGSIDDSLNICYNYSNKYKNIKVLTQKNSGVSVARNNGIKNAKGKYIMLLDSDDYLSKNTIKKLYDFFEKHYNDIDLLTYPIKFDRNGKISKNIRYDAYDKGTGIYDINEYIYLNQSTVNIMIKNEFEKTNLYDTNMKLSEDQNFDTQLIMKKEKIGFVEDAIYYYRRYDGSVSSSRNNPYYCFEDIMNYNEGLLKKYQKNGKISQYIQSLVINTIKWRMRTDQLFPYYLDKDEYKKAIERIKKIIKQIEPEVIMNVVDMNLYHKIFLLKFSGHKIKVILEDTINVYCDEKIVYISKNILGSISKLKVKNDTLYFMADLLNPILEYNIPDIFIEKKYIDGTIEKEKIKINESNESYYMARFKTTKAYYFDISFKIDNIKSFKLYAIIDDKKINIEFKFKKFTSNNILVKNYNLLYSKKENCFKVRKKNLFNVIKNKYRNFLKCYKHNKKALVYRILYYFYPIKNNIWIYTDRGDALDNAYTQFKHDFIKKDNKRRYYVSQFNDEQINKIFNSKEKKYVIKQGSFKNKMLYLHSQKIISSFIDLQVYCPFNSSVIYYNDLTHYDLIYLQHGILHANLIKMYAKEYTEVDKFVISTNFEKENLINKYHYNEQDLLPTGMPRMELNLKNKITKNKILFAPSWRKYLIGDLIKNKRKLKKNEFINSNFYKEIYNFLNSDELNNYLKENNLKLDFKLHPIFKGYSNLFNLNNNENIELNFNKINIYEYKIFITDFSSFQFDFVKLKRPIIYFMPDMSEFKAGLHTYRELDLNYEDAFGKLCLTSNELIKEMKNITKNDYKLQKKYLDRMNNFFIEIKNPCEDIYNNLKEL